VDAILARLERAPRSPDLRADAARALAQTARVLGGAGTAEEAAAAGALAAKVLDRTGRSDPDLLAAVAGLEAAAGRPREAVLICEEALRLPAARRAHQEDLARFRQRALPDLVSSASIDAALDEPVAIIPEGAAWRYFPGFDEPSAELAWTAAEFADAGWLEGPSGFGFADGDDATVVAGLQGAATTIYLRHRFEVEGPQAFSGLVLSVKADDGFIAYLNGGEIGRVRAGAPGARLPFDAVASALAAEPLAWERISVPREALRPGRNVLAVQGLNQAKASSDFTLIPVLAGVPAADLDGERARFAAFRNAAGGPDREFRLQYLEGRLLARAGKSQEAGAVFEAAAAAAASRAEPALRIAELLRTSGDAAGAEARLRRVLAAADRDAAAVVWDLWFAIVAGDLKRDGRSLIASLPPAGAADGERLADIRWALSEIRDRKAIRMSAGGREFRDRNGRVWSADRFHQGVSEGRPISYPAAAIPVGEQRYAAQQSVVASPAVKHAGRLLAGDLYASRRTFGAEGLHPPGYRIPLPAGRYTVAVHFPSPPVLVEPGSSLAAATALPRIGLVLEGQRVLSGHEPPAPDEGTAGVERFELTVSDGFLDLEVIPERGEAALCALAIEVAG
jgi:hypothetical protein